MALKIILKIKYKNELAYDSFVSSHTANQTRQDKCIQEPFNTRTTEAIIHNITVCVCVCSEEEEADECEKLTLGIRTMVSMRTRAHTWMKTVGGGRGCAHYGPNPIRTEERTKHAHKHTN